MGGKDSISKRFQALTFGLARRLMLVFSALIIVFVAAVITINMQTQRGQLLEHLEHSADHLVSLSQEVSIPYILENNPADLEVFFQEVGSRSDVERLFLVDPQRWLLVSGGDVDMQFLSLVTDPLIEQVLETRAPQHVYADRAVHVAAPLIVGNSVLGVLRLDYSQKDLASKMNAVLLNNLMAGCVFLLVGLAFSRMVAGRLSRPLIELTQTVRCAADGDLDAEISLKSNDEFAQLGTTFNTMMHNLKNSMYEIHRVAYEDKVTGVPNRSWLNNQLEHLALHYTQSDTGFAVMFLDLDKFKAVNDTHGHHVGDLLLRGFSRRLARCMREQGLTLLSVDSDERHLADVENNEAVLARLGGDEFTLIVPSDKADALATHIVAEMARPFKVDGCQLSNTTSIGIALFPTHATSREHLLKCADVAMYQAKRSGRNTHRYYDHSTHTRLIERSALERDLELAVEQDSFEMFLQPQFGVQSDEVVGAEALIRWERPSKGRLAPDTFLPVAASMGLLPKIGQLMVRKAIEAAARINRTRTETLAIAVNVTIEELNEEGFADMVKHWLDLYEANPRTLEIEITEHTAMEESVLVERQVAELREIGVRFAIDDFGMGYSNLGRLKTLAFETLKIDRSLVTGVGEDPASESLLLTILDMAKAIEADVVAEGIETAEQLAFLRATGCDYYQGYYSGKPMPAAMFTRWVASQSKDSTQPDNTRQQLAS
ncbi:MAG: EAL domain-containing protein [Pseudomonadota bacterium]